MAATFSDKGPQSTRRRQPRFDRARSRVTQDAASAGAAAPPPPAAGCALPRRIPRCEYVVLIRRKLQSAAPICFSPTFADLARPSAPAAVFTGWVRYQKAYGGCRGRAQWCRGDAQRARRGGAARRAAVVLSLWCAPATPQFFVPVCALQCQPGPTSSVVNEFLLYAHARHLTGPTPAQRPPAQRPPARRSRCCSMMTGTTQLAA